MAVTSPMLGSMSAARPVVSQQPVTDAGTNPGAIDPRGNNGQIPGPSAGTTPSASGTPATPSATPGTGGPSASQFSSIANSFAPGSAMAQMFAGFANNPSAANNPDIAQEITGALSTPYLTGANYQANVNAIANGQPGVASTAYTGPPPGTSLAGLNVPSNTPGLQTGAGTGPLAPLPSNTPTPTTQSTLSGGQQGNQSNSNLQSFLNYFGQLQSFMNGNIGNTPQQNPIQQLMSLLGGSPGGGGSTYNGGSQGGDLLQMLGVLYGGQGYNPYGLPLYNRQQIQWPTIP